MATIKIKNVTSFARDGVVNVGIPFSKDDNIRPGDYLVVNGANGTVNQYVQWYPQGATWDNGAIKYVRAYFKTSLSSNEEKIATVTKSGTLGTQSLAVFDSSIPGLTATQFKFRISALGGANGVTPVYHEEPFNVTFGPELGWSLENDVGIYNPYWRQIYFKRLNTQDPYLKQVWIQFVIELLDGVPYTNFFFRFGFGEVRSRKSNGQLFGPLLSNQGLYNRDGTPYIVPNNQGQPVQATGPANYESETIEPSLWLNSLPGYGFQGDFNAIAVQLDIEGCQSRIRAEQWKLENIQDLPSPLVGRRYDLIRPYRNWAAVTPGSWNATYNPIRPSSKGQRLFMVGTSHCYKGVLCFDNSSTCQAELQNYVPTTTSSTSSSATFNITKASVFPIANQYYAPSSQILAMAEDWKNFYPATNAQPPRPSYITSELDYFQRSSNLLATLAKAGPSNPNLVPSGFTSNKKQAYNHAYLGPNIDTTDAGEHGTRTYAYGLRGFPFMQTTNYYWIPLLEYNTRQESIRPNWFLGNGTEGQPIGKPLSPDFLRNGPGNAWQSGGWIAYWNGTFYFADGYRTGGYNRSPSTEDSTLAEFGKTTWGPDKEHMTNNIILIQSLITMDWFGLEYADNHASHIIASQRTDNSVGANSASLNNWGVSRAVGRVSQMFAFLYEVTGREDVRYWAKRRLVDNIASLGGSTSDSAWLLTPANVGGIEKIRCATNNGPSEQGAGLNNSITLNTPQARHWRPWEEGEVVLGFYVLAKCLLSKDPNDAEGLAYLRHSRDVAASIITHGVPDLREGPAPGDGSNRRNRYLLMTFPNTAQRWEFMKLLAPLVNGQTNRTFFSSTAVSSLPIVRGASSGAEGRVRLIYTDGEFNWNRNLTLWLTNASGTFVPGEIVQVTNNPGFTYVGTVYLNRTLQGYKCKTLNSPTRGFGYDITEDEEDAIAFQNQGGFNESILTDAQGANLAGGWNGYGYHGYTRYYHVYESVVAASHAIGKEAAQIGYYQNSAEYPNANAFILARAISYSEDQASRWDLAFSSTDYIVDYSRDINERYRCFVGYVNRALYEAGPAIVQAPVQTCFTSSPNPTVSIANQQINVTVNAPASTCTFIVETAGINIQTPISYEARPSGLDLLFDINRGPTTRLSTVRNTSSSSISFEPVLINGVYLTSVLPGRKTFVTIIMGPVPVEPPFEGGPDSGPDPAYFSLHYPQSSYYTELEKYGITEEPTL